MKILYFTIQINLIGGYSRIVIDKANWLAQHGYDVTICDIESWPTPPCYPLDKKVDFIQGNMDTTPGGILRRLKGTLSAVRRIKQIIRQVRPDVIVNAHCPIVAYSLPFVCLDIPKIIECHQSMQGIETFDRNMSSGFFSWFHRWSIRWIYGQYDSLIVLTEEDKRVWNLKNCEVIYNFSNLTCAAEEKPISNSDKHQIILLARLAAQKRIDLMIKIWERLFKKFPNWSVKVLGEGDQRPILEKMIAERRMEDSFLLPGAVQDVRPEVLKSDIFCLTSEYEGFGIVIIEAMQMGLPAIAFEFVGVHDIIEDNETGFIVPFPDIDRYADRLRLLISDKNERIRLSANARKSVKKFDKERIMEQWEAIFYRLSDCK